MLAAIIELIWCHRLLVFPGFIYYPQVVVTRSTVSFMWRSIRNSRFRIEVFCIIVSAPTVRVTPFDKIGLPLKISHSALLYINFSQQSAIQ